MDKNLINETKSFLTMIQSYQEELSTLHFEEKGIDTVNTHLKKSISESEEAAEKILDNIHRSLKYIEEIRSVCATMRSEGTTAEAEKIEQMLDIVQKNTVENLTLMEFQDILAQRLLKSSGLLDDLKSKMLKLILLMGINENENDEARQQMEAKLNEIAWEKEVDQDDVDDILRQFGL